MSRRDALAQIPGSDSFSELVHLLRAPTTFFHRRFREHGPVFKTRFVYPVVFLIGADANKTMLNTRRAEFSMGRGYQQTAINRVFEGSIMLQDGEEHLRTRATLKPALDRLAVRDTTQQVHEIWARHATSRADGNSHDVYETAEQATFEVAASVLSGLGLVAEHDEIRPYFERLNEGIMAPVPWRIPFGRLDRALTARKKLFEFLRPRIDAARRDGAPGLVGQMVQQRDGDRILTTDEIIGHLLLLMWAGYDTTASAGAWILHVLARRPDLQASLRAEITAVLGDGIDGIDNGRGLTELTAFLREIERMYPSALFFPRITTCDVEYAGYKIHEGTPAFYSPYMTHRDPAMYDAPNVFDPTRWTREGGARASKLVGFGGGARVCIGKMFALMQLRIAIQTLLTRFTIAPDPESKWSVMGVPVHHPKNSRIRLLPLAS